MKHDSRTVLAWALVSAMAILFLTIAITVGAGIMHDPPSLGHGFLALLFIGVAMTLAVGGRRRAMVGVCAGLAILEGAFLAAFWWGDVPTLRGLVLAGVTVGGLCAAAVMFGLQGVLPPQRDQAVID